jgi:hypothetical protein
MTDAEAKHAGTRVTTCGGGARSPSERTEMMNPDNQYSPHANEPFILYFVAKRISDVKNKFALAGFPNAKSAHQK